MSVVLALLYTDDLLMSDTDAGSDDDDDGGSHATGVLISSYTALVAAVTVSYGDVDDDAARDAR